MLLHAAQRHCGGVVVLHSNHLQSYTTRTTHPTRLVRTHSLFRHASPRITIPSQSTRPLVCAAGAMSAPPPSDDTLRNDKLEWLTIDPDVRSRVQNAVEALGNSATVGDTAARAGVSIPQAERALQALAADTHGVLKVSDRGDVVYTFSRDFKRTLVQRSAWLRLEPVLQGAQRVGAYLSRVVFGTTLVASILLVYVTLVALMTASRSSNDRDDRYRSQPVFINTWGWGDMFWYWDPYYVRHRHRGHGRKGGSSMNFMEGIFSFVFGDGDPNIDIAERRWALVGQYIQSRGGVVAAEEVAPYLPLDADAQGQGSGEGSLYGDESFMMPVCLKFGGSPVVDENGRIVYQFPSLQVTARQRPVQPPAERALQEQPWTLTQADGLQVAASVGLGVMNFVGVVALTQLLQDPTARFALANSGLAFMGGLLPYLAAYAVAFFAIPAVRWVQNTIRNAGVARRNETRMSYLQQLANPGPALQAKLNAARRLATTTRVDDKNVVFRTDREVGQQVNEFEEFDQKLGGQPGREEEDDWRGQVFRRAQQRTPPR